MQEWLDNNSALRIEMNSKAPKFKVDDRVRITKYKNIFSRKSS